LRPFFFLPIFWGHFSLLPKPFLSPLTATKLPPLIRKYDDKLEVRNHESAKSLVADILHYKTPVSTKAIRSGIVNEPIVRAQYRRIIRSDHSNFRLEETGLVVSTEIAYIGASPDALVRFDCCGEGLAEFKTTWTHTEKNSKEFAEISGTCLKVNEGPIKLVRNHMYYYETQMLLGVSKKSYFDFFLMTSVGHYCEWIRLDEDLWQSCLPKLKVFFTEYILPVLFTCDLKTEFQ